METKSLSKLCKLHHRVLKCVFICKLQELDSSIFRLNVTQRHQSGGAYSDLSPTAQMLLRPYIHSLLISESTHGLLTQTHPSTNTFLPPVCHITSFGHAPFMTYLRVEGFLCPLSAWHTSSGSICLTLATKHLLKVKAALIVTYLSV